MRCRDYALLADLLEFPSAGFLKRVEITREAFRDRCPKAAAELDDFLALLPKDSIDAIQELHTRSFDVQSLTALDVGYVLFGEDYKRGELLANLSREHKAVENDCGVELGDHLTNLLRLLSKMPDAELMEEMVQELIGPAIRKMIAEFNPERVAKKDDVYRKHHKTVIEASQSGRLLYLHVLRAVEEVLIADFGLTDTPLIEQTSDFLKSVGTEMHIEGADGRAC